MERLERAHRIADLTWGPTWLRMERAGKFGAWCFGVYASHRLLPMAVGRGSSLDAAADALLEVVERKAAERMAVWTGGDDQDRECAHVLRLELSSPEDPIEHARRRVG